MVTAKGVSGTKTTRTFFPFYVEEKVGSNAPTIIKYYTFNGMTIAMKRGNDLRYLHSDHLGSNTLVTNADGTLHSSQNYCAYGGQRIATMFGEQCDPTAANALPTDRTYTGQEQDTTGLMYFRARYYDSALGTFLSPDTLVPEPGVVFDYNRYMYVRGNALKYNDPSGHCSDSSQSGVGWIGNYSGDAYEGGCDPYWKSRAMGENPLEVSWGPTQSIEDNWIDLGFDWLLQKGPDERVFGQETQMVESLKNHPGVNAARIAWLNDTYNAETGYPHDFGPNGYIRAWREGDGVGHFLGSYLVRISDNGDSTVTFEVTNLTGRQSMTNTRRGPGVSAEQLSKEKNWKALVQFQWRWVLKDQQREDVDWGGNYNQIYTWTEDLP